MFGPALIVPEDEMFWLIVTAATVKPATAKAATVKIITSNFGDFFADDFFVELLALRRDL